MQHRHRQSKRKSKRQFKRTANTTHKFNVRNPPAHMRGGVRL